MFCLSDRNENERLLYMKRQIKYCVLVCLIESISLIIFSQKAKEHMLKAVFHFFYEIEFEIYKSV